MVMSGRVVMVILDLPDPSNCTNNTVSVQFTGERLCVPIQVTPPITITGMNVTSCGAIVKLEPYTNYNNVTVSEKSCVLNNDSELMTGEEGLQTLL